MRARRRRVTILRAMPAALTLGWLLAAPAVFGQVSAGGAYSLDASIQPSGGGGEDLVGASYWAKGAIGQPLLPATAPGVVDSLDGGASQCREGFLNPVHFSLQNAVANDVQSPSGAASMSLPALAVGSPTFDVVFRQDPLNNPLSVDPSLIRHADDAMVALNGPLAQVAPNDIFEVHTMDDRGLHDGPLGATGRISFGYTDAGNGTVAGTNPPVRVGTLELFVLDENAGLWVRVPGSSVETGNKVVSAPLNHLSVYAMIGGADTQVSQAYAFPVPFRPHGPNAGTGPGQTGTDAAGITFTNLPSEGRVEIYDLAGRLVRGLDIPSNLVPAQLVWDTRNDAGRAAASGAYIWRVVDGQNSKVGRLVIIR